MVGAAYQLPRPGQVAVALSAQPGELNDAVLARAELEHVQGNQQDLLREATAAGVVAAGADAPPAGATPGLEGVICAASGRTLGGLAAVPVGECAPEDSSGFCSGGL